MAFIFMAPIGLVLSIIGVVKSKKAGAKYGLGIAGIVLNAIGVIIMFLMLLSMISYMNLTNKAQNSQMQYNNSIYDGLDN